VAGTDFLSSTAILHSNNPYRLMSALLPKADIGGHDYDVRFVPEADIATDRQYGFR
jgi:hypothetical protein